MAIYRIVQMGFWTDSKVVDEFTPEDRYFYLYLFTNPHTNLCGCYEVSVRQMAYELGYDKAVVERLLKRFSEVHKIRKRYCFLTGIDITGLLRRNSESHYLGKSKRLKIPISNSTSKRF